MSAKYTFLAWDTPIDNAPLKLSLLQIANNSDDNGFSYYSISKMAKACGMSERTFMRKIAELEKMGVLVVERRANRSSLYKLIGDEMGVTLCHLQSTEVTESHPEVTESHPQGDRESHDPNSIPNTTPESIKDIDQKSDLAFESFWKHWPSKKGKKAAGQKFESVFKRLCKENSVKGTIETKQKWANKLIADIQQRLANGQYGFDKMHATTYLNGERWTDDHETNNQRNASTGRKLSAVEENNARLLAKYGNPTASSERTINPAECAGMDSHEVLGGLQQQVASHGVTLDMDSGDLGDDSEGNPQLGF